MNKLSILIIILFSAVLTSCFDDVANIAEEIEATPNIIGFVDRNENIGGIADGSEYEFLFPVEVYGPTSDELTGEYSANVVVDESSTAIEGVHYRLEEEVIAANDEGDFLSLFKVVMLTEGIETPLEENPVLILNVENVQGPGNVVASGAPLVIEMLYLCPSYLAGEYEVTIKGSAGTVVRNETIVETGAGEYRGTHVGLWTPAQLGGTPGFTFLDVCGTISVPSQNLVDTYSNMVTQAGDSFVDPETGNIVIKYAVDGYGTFTATYVKQ